MKKKIALLLPWLKMGGTNKVALRFTRQLQKHFDVTIILSNNAGELLDEIPNGIKLIIDHKDKFRDIVSADIHKFNILKLIDDSVYYSKIKTGLDSVDNLRYLICRNELLSDDEFDCAISYHGQSPEQLLNLLYRIRSRKKVAWIHGEFNNSVRHYRKMEKYYRKLDHIFFVSNATKQSFLEKFNVDDNLCSIYYNPLDKFEILSKADQICKTSFDKKKINLLTVGRFSKEKGQDMIPFITRNLIDMGYPICWYLIGDGDTLQYVKELAVKYGINDHIIFMGVEKNPYCYMKNCNIYIQPSYTEGYSTTICEAAILGKPIIGTKSSGGIAEQITNGEDGLIVDASVDGLTRGIIKLIEDDALQKKFSTEIVKKDFEGSGELNKFLNYLGIEGN